MKRNITDFNRGSQLIAHFAQMFAAGFRVPLFAGIVLFAGFTWYEFRGSLSDHQLYLIGIKLYAAVWGFMEFDSTKMVTLQSGFGGTFDLNIANVAGFPPVVRAWGAFVAVLEHAAWRTLLILAPLLIVFFWVAARFGEHSKARQHQRGRWLATTAELVRMVRAYNRACEADELRKALGRGWRFATRAERANVGLLHRPFSLAGVPWPWRQEQTHAMLIGSTGTGKTVAMMDLLDQIRARGTRSVVFDLTGAYVSTYFDPGRDIILHPLDARCPRWSIFDECRNAAEFMGAAEALVPADGGGDSQFWVQGARMLFTSMCVSLVEQGMATNEDLADSLMTADLATVHEFVKDTPAAPMSSPDSPRLADSVRAVFNANAQALLYLPATGPRFSIRDWIGEGKDDGAILFVAARYVDLPICRQLLTLWLNSAVNTLMRAKTSRSLKMWFLIDELGALHRLPALEEGMQTARNFGGAFVTGVHTQAKLKDTYGPNAASNLSALAKTKLILANPDPETARWCSELIGNGEVQDMNEGFSFSYKNTRDSVNLSPERHEVRIVLGEEIGSLDPLHGYLCLPGSLPPAPVELEPVDRPTVAEPFIMRADFDLVPGSKRKPGRGLGKASASETNGEGTDNDGEGGKAARPPRMKLEPGLRRRSRDPQQREQSEQPVQARLDLHDALPLPLVDAKAVPTASPEDVASDADLAASAPHRDGVPDASALPASPSPIADGVAPSNAPHGPRGDLTATRRQSARKQAAIARDLDGPGAIERDPALDLGDFGSA